MKCGSKALGAALRIHHHVTTNLLNLMAALETVRWMIRNSAQGSIGLKGSLGVVQRLEKDDFY